MKMLKMEILDDNETAAVIPGYPDYAATSNGRILSFKSGLPVELSQGVTSGYHHVTLYDTSGTGSGKSMYVHRLVCSAFHGKPDEAGLDACHINHDPSDNRAVNLEWGTREENNHQKRGNGTYGRILTRELVMELRKRHADGGVSYQDLADELTDRLGVDVSYHCVWQAIKGKSWSHLPMPVEQRRRRTVAKLKRLKNLTEQA